MYSFIGASLSELYTSRSNGTSVVFTKIYMEMQITDTSVMRSQMFMFKSRVKN